jgi:hypothetical protein
MPDSIDMLKTRLNPYEREKVCILKKIILFIHAKDRWAGEIARFPNKGISQISSPTVHFMEKTFFLLLASRERGRHPSRGTSLHRQ